MFPVRCYTCNKFIGHKYREYTCRVTNDESKKHVMDSLQIERMCCRRMFLGHVHVISDLLKFSNEDIVLDDSGTALYRNVQQTRTVSCD